jgi:hypothetical protein
MKRKTSSDKVWEVIAYIGAVLGIIGIILIILKIVGLL